MPKTQKVKKSKKKKSKSKAKAPTVDAIEECALLGEDDVVNKGVDISLETSLLEAELLNETVVQTKKSKRLKRRHDPIPAVQEEEVPHELVNELIVEEVKSADLRDVPVPSVKDHQENEAESEKGDPQLEVEIGNNLPIIEVPEPEITPTKLTNEVEVDIYSDLSTAENPEMPISDPQIGEEVTLDEVLKMETKVMSGKDAKIIIEKHPLSEEEEDLDYGDIEDKEDDSPMKISVLVGGSKELKRKLSPTYTPSEILPRVPVATPAHPPPVILPPLPHTHITIPPLLPMPQAPPSFNQKPFRSSGRIIYINPKFRTDVILRNMEAQGIIRGGGFAIHMNREHKKNKSNSQYVPSPLIQGGVGQKGELDEATTTLLITDLSVCTTRSRIRELFCSVGTVKEVLTYPSERRAVVTFESARDAVVCRRKFHRSVVDGSCMTVNFAI